MAKVNDLTGKRFERLVVIARGEGKRGRARWICKCDCGSISTVFGFNLIKGTTTSCGCKNNERHKREFKDLASKKFGKLTVQKDLGKTGKNAEGHLWECVCDCGNVTTATKKALFGGDKVSCGCVRELNFATMASKYREKNNVEGTNLANIYMKKPNKNNSSGVRGVWWCSRLQKWEAGARVKGKQYSYGFYKTVEEAAKAREIAVNELFVPIFEKYNLA